MQHKTITEINIGQLKLWDKNPRAINVDRFDELKHRIERDGFNDVLKVAADGKTVIGGNMRLRALKELGHDTVQVLLTEAKTDQEIFRVALSDNEEFGYYDTGALSELALTLDIPELELRTFELHVDKPKTLIDVMSELMPTEDDETKPKEGMTIECENCGAKLDTMGNLKEDNIDG